MTKETENSTSGYLDMQLLRFTTAGSVDDGKSTLIGRLLYDSKSIFEDQMDAVREASERRGDEHVNLALLTDGLRAEREQGITIDVAYRYFATPKRKFIIADTPGHIQYTRNMVTGASSANLAIILIDARHGVLEQTIRHSYIASLLRIPHILICVNKMDLVEFKEERFEEIKKQFNEFSSKLDVQDVRFLPISALKGDNVVDRSENMLWYKGPTLLYLLETIHIASDRNFVDGRFPVQYVIRPQSEKYPDFRGYAGRIASGIFKKNDKVKILPSGLTSRIKSIETMSGELNEAFTPMSVTLVLEDNIDISRGDMIVLDNKEPEVNKEIDLMVCWLSEKALIPNGKYILRHTTNDALCIIKEISYKVNINNLEKNYDDLNVGLNEIARIKIKSSKPVFFDSYRRNRITGSLIIVEEGTNNTVGAGMIV
ncbi:MAG: sulfate adenylyltransferase subunit CysN [Bacteroidales bacterium]|nr:sulfate adenylyltransferase subunit CysN [Bacteroidales bacterium]MCF8392021.1 sulfate adenylyltransferase subunit CysN [Bacteroidales bacterium]